jgi:hypothetical protein
VSDISRPETASNVTHVMPSTMASVSAMSCTSAYSYSSFIAAADGTSVEALHLLTWTYSIMCMTVAQTMVLRTQVRLYVQPPEPCGMHPDWTCVLHHRCC